ncbi:hypothetical protein [Afipia massiliensis]|nr:hypothetical protein [Afipia massiliensis]
MNTTLPTGADPEAATPVAATPVPADPMPPKPELQMMGLRSVLIILALVEAWFGFFDAPVLFGDMSHIGSGIGSGLVKAHLAAHPVLAVAAIAFASLGYVRHAIIALGTIIIMSWLSDMPSVVAHGLEFKSAFSAVETIAKVIAFPLIAACAIAYAAHNEHLGRATFLVAVPTLFNVVLIVGFAIGVMIYGF